MDWFTVTAPCGLDCFNCEMYEKNVTPQLQTAIAAQTGKAPEEVSCKGCRRQNGCFLLPGCETLKCVRSKQVDFCYQCSDFPCEKLAPCSQGAEKYPHNYKIFNLCRIKSAGLEAWAEKEARSIRDRYFKGRFVIGRGPLL